MSYRCKDLRVGAGQGFGPVSRAWQKGNAGTRVERGAQPELPPVLPAPSTGTAAAHRATPADGFSGEGRKQTREIREQNTLAAIARQPGGTTCLRGAPALGARCLP